MPTRRQDVHDLRVSAKGFRSLLFKAQTTINKKNTYLPVPYKSSQQESSLTCKPSILQITLTFLQSINSHHVY